jgi:hypothetical protein
MTRRLLTLVLCFAAFAAIPAFADVIVGLPADTGTGNCFPFGCAYPNGEYQQVYNAGQFSGPITITGLEFFNTQVDFGATSMNDGNWTVSMSTTSADWNTLNPNFTSNIGANNTQVFNGDLVQPWTFGDTLTINFSTPFTYDPSKGNLLMDVMVSGATDAGGPIYFDTNGYNNGNFNGNTFLGRVYTTNNVNAGYGLVTGFVTGASVPEPSFLLLVGMGLGLAGIVNVRRNRRVKG